MRIYLLALLLLIPLLCLSLPGAQFPQLPDASSPSPRMSGRGRGAPEDEARIRIQKDMEKKANEERQRQLQNDTEKLLKLANELKEYVDKSNKDVLSLDVVKKAEEIEKLAHNVKEKMKTSY